jgi:hypothetical protein
MYAARLPQAITRLRVKLVPTKPRESVGGAPLPLDSLHSERCRPCASGPIRDIQSVATNFRFGSNPDLNGRLNRLLRALAIGSADKLRRQFPAVGLRQTTFCCYNGSQ